MEGDGLTNLEEFLAGTNPNDHDTDGDGMPDGWEAESGLDPLTDDAGFDLDNDGLTNAEEFVGGTDPGNPDTLWGEGEGSGGGFTMSCALYLESGLPLESIVGDLLALAAVITVLHLRRSRRQGSLGVFEGIARSDDHR